MKKNKSALNDWLRPEYKRSDLGEIVRGKYSKKINTSTNVVMLDPKNAKVFPNDEAVNKALSGLVEVAQSAVQGLIPRATRTARKRATG